MSAIANIPIVLSAVKERRQVAAIDFGTTYSGYAMSLRQDFLDNPLKIRTNQFVQPGNTTSLKTSSCILFSPNEEFDSFGFTAEDKYAALAMDEKHANWFFFKRFKMLLYENKKLTKATRLKDDKGLEMAAMKVFTESIRYLKDHLIKTCEKQSYGLIFDDIHWVLTVPAIWDDSAKQFMREAALNAGIAADHLSLALEPEVASLFCRYLPTDKIESDGISSVAPFSAGRKYLVVDAGGGTIDITVHETQADGTVRELFKANGGPWGGTKIDKAFLQFLSDITSKEAMITFEKNHKDDYLDLLREFEIKKRTIGPDVVDSVTIRIPSSLENVFRQIHGKDVRESALAKQDFHDQISFAGNKIRVKPDQFKLFFKETCSNIVGHIQTILKETVVKGTNTILMVGGFSESKMLKDAIRKNFGSMTIIIPEEATLAVLKGAVLFGHNPTFIKSRVSKYTYGVKTHKTFVKNVHDESRKCLIDGKLTCRDCFDKHVNIGQEVQVGTTFEEKRYFPISRAAKGASIKVFRSTQNDPKYVDDPGCTFLGDMTVDLSMIQSYEDKAMDVKMIYGGAEFLQVDAKVPKTGARLDVKLNILPDL